MNTINSSFMKALLAIIIVGIASFSIAFLIDNTIVYRPIHNTNFQLIDESGDVAEAYIDIVNYGSIDQGNNILLYLEVLGSINQSGADYSLVIVAKRPRDDVAHIYNVMIDNGIDTSYGSLITINNSRLEVTFSKSNFIPDSYMVGIEARILGIEEDITQSARNNPLITKIFGIF